MSNKTELFKMDARNMIRVWTCWVEEYPTKTILVIRHGINGQQQIFNRDEYTGYNHLEAAQSEASTRINRQRDRRGYSETIPSTRPFRPMLCKNLKDNWDHIPPQVYIQPKLNGMRCMASSTWMMSRAGTNIYSLPHIQQALSTLPPEVVLDGELYCHNQSIEFVMSMCKRNERIPENIRISFYVFDIADETLNYNARLEYTRDLFAEHFPSAQNNLPHEDYKHPTNPNLPISFPTNPSPIGHVRLLNTLDIPSTEIEEHHKFFLSNGYEGSIVRNPRTPYQFNVRSPGLFKYKPVERMNCLCLDVVPCEHAKDQAKLILRAPNRTSFTCQIKGTHDYRKQLLRRPHLVLNKLVEIEYETLSDDNKPLKPVATKIHA